MPKETQDACERAAEEICRLPPNLRPGWIVYILESIDERSEGDAVLGDTLLRVQEAIEDRLIEGRW